MLKIIGECSTGKTKKLMQYALDNSLIFVCQDPERMAIKAHEYGLIGIQFISYCDFSERCHMNGQKFVIDELENYVQWCGNYSVDGYTLTED